MRKFLCISSFAKRTEDNILTGEYAEKNTEIDIPESQISRLINAGCIVPLDNGNNKIETKIREAPEAQIRKRRPYIRHVYK